jgi:hypothetical protein
VQRNFNNVARSPEQTRVINGRIRTWRSVWHTDRATAVKACDAIVANRDVPSDLAETLSSCFTRKAA